jgi:hypothetical protein
MTKAFHWFLLPLTEALQQKPATNQSTPQLEQGWSG